MSSKVLKFPKQDELESAGGPALAALPKAPIDDHAAQLESIAKAVEQLQATAILEIAKHLAEARELFRYRRDEGGFGGWVESRLRYSRQTAYNLLHVYQQFGSGEFVKHLDTFPASILSARRTLDPRVRPRRDP